MSSPRRRSNEERREHSTHQVLSAALQLFVANGYTNTSIDDIAIRAGLTKGAVYFYFKGKAALLHELLEQSEALYGAIFDTMQSSGKSAAKQLEMFVDWCAEVGAANKESLLLPILVSLEFYGRDESIEKHVRDMYNRYHDQMERVTRLGQAGGEFDDSLAPHERAAVLVAMTDGMLLEWYRFGDRLNGSTLARNARAQIFDGILTRN